MVLGKRHTADPRHIAWPLWGAFLPMLAAVTIALPLITSRMAVIAIVLVAVLAATIAMILTGLRRHRPPAPMPWYLLAGSVVLFTIGIALRELFSSDHYLFDDVFTLGGYAGVFVAALLWLAPRRVRDSRGLLLDSGLIGLGALLASWTLLISPLMDNGLSLHAALWACYPVIDALLLTVVAHSVVTSTRSETSLRLVHASLSAILLADFGYNLEAADSLHLPHRILVVPLLIAFLLVGLAALHPAMVTLGQQRRVHPDQSRQRAGVIAAVLVVAALVPTVGTRPGVYDRAVVSVLLAMLLIGVLLRSERAIVRSARSERRAQYQADHDMLTGLLNRSALLRAPARNHERWAGRTLCLLFIDLDGFKLVNDSYGHAIGDELIANAAARIRRIIRHDDVAARYGGDEFVVLTCTDRSETATLAEKLIAAFGRPFELSVGAVSITASIGIACGAPRSDTVHESGEPAFQTDEPWPGNRHAAGTANTAHSAESAAAPRTGPPAADAHAEPSPDAEPATAAADIARTERSRDGRQSWPSPDGWQPELTGNGRQPEPSENRRRPEQSPGGWQPEPSGDSWQPGQSRDGRQSRPRLAAAPGGTSVAASRDTEPTTMRPNVFRPTITPETGQPAQSTSGTSAAASPQGASSTASQTAAPAGAFAPRSPGGTPTPEYGHLIPGTARPRAPRDGAPPEITVYDLLREADSAMYHAKEYSLGYVFRDEMRPHGHPEARRTWRTERHTPHTHHETTV